MRATWIIPCRNKHQHVERCVRSVFAQTHPCEIILSNQGSMDGTREIIARLADEYTGPHTVRVLDCPHTDFKGMRGLNDHLNWVHDQIDTDIVLVTSADDYTRPERTARVVKVFEETNASWVGTTTEFVSEDGTGDVAHTYFENRATRWIGLAEGIRFQIGSSGSNAWAFDLYKKYAPMTGIDSPDVLLPVMAMLERGMYFIDEPLQTYVSRADPENLGLEGQLRAATDSDDQMRLAEVNAYHNSHNWMVVRERIIRHGHADMMHGDPLNALYDKIIGSVRGWCQTREALTLARVQPMGMRV